MSENFHIVIFYGGFGGHCFVFEPESDYDSVEAFEKAADGRATKIIVPSKIQEIAGLVKSITEVAADEEDKKE